MKSRAIFLLLLLCTISLPLPAQQTRADRKLLNGIHAKAENGDARSQTILGEAFMLGELGATKDEGEAVKWFHKAANQDNASAEFNLGFCYNNGYGVPKDNKEAVKWYRKAADQGDASAQCNLGYCYDTGQGVAKNNVEAVNWYRKAAEQKLAMAQFDLGYSYDTGQGVAKNEVEAVRWYQNAAEQDNAAAKFNLGRCYANGQGVAKDEAEAVKWYRKAAEQGIANAEGELGYCYLYGQGVERDEFEAVKWFLEAADNNDVRAEYNLGFCYQNGKGVQRDDVEAVKWYRQAAEQNDSEAQFNLGACYFNSQGVPKDYVQSYKWFTLAFAQGNELAKRNLPIVKSRMTPQQITAGQNLARNFKPREKFATVFIPSAPSKFITIQTERKASGTGFFITEDGYLISNYHVVKDAAQVRLVTSAGLIAAKVVRVDAANDLALLKAEGRFMPLPVAASRTAHLGNTVATVGFPNIGMQGFAPKFAKGEIAALSGAGDDARYFQISVPLQPGNSGGALVDEHGNVVGVVSAKLDAATALAASGALPENVNYAVKSSLLLSFLESTPEVSAKLKDVNGKEIRFEEVVERAKQAAVLVLVY